MADGFFRLLVTSVSVVGRAVDAESSGWRAQGSSTTTDQDFIDAYNNNNGIGLTTGFADVSGGSASGSVSYGFSHSLPCISLDGGAAISFDDLPAGFKVVEDSVSLSCGVFVTSFAPGTTVTAEFSSGALRSSFDQDIIPTLNLSESFGASIQISGTPTISSLLSRNFELSGGLVTNRVSGGGAWIAGPGFDSLSFIGAYEIELFQFQFSIENESPVTPGNEIEVTSDPHAEHPLDFNDVTEVVINYKTTDNVDHTVTITQFLFQGPNSLIFILPDIGDAPTVEIEVTVDGTQFSGTVPLGTLLTIFLTNGTGIYRIVPGKTNDTLYVQDYDPVETVDVKIPNPFFKTGFLPDV